MYAPNDAKHVNVSYYIGDWWNKKKKPASQVNTDRWQVRTMVWCARYKNSRDDDVLKSSFMWSHQSTRAI